jgi:hypothetical protein
MSAEVVGRSKINYGAKSPELLIAGDFSFGAN